jgi:hypothetical protein
MNNKIISTAAKLLKIGFCGFCYFVRVRGGKALTLTRTGAHGHTPIQNNKNNKIIFIIYIIEIGEGFCDRLGFCE